MKEIIKVDIEEIIENVSFKSKVYLDRMRQRYRGNKNYSKRIECLKRNLNILKGNSIYLNKEA